MADPAGKKLVGGAVEAELQALAAAMLANHDANPNVLAVTTDGDHLVVLLLWPDEVARPSTYRGAGRSVRGLALGRRRCQ
jgi:hypothetical protein